MIKLIVPMREPWKDNASNDLCLWTSMMAGMMSPGLYAWTGRLLVDSMISSCRLSDALIPSETDEPIVKLEAMSQVGFDQVVVST